MGLTGIITPEDPDKLTEQTREDRVSCSIQGPGPTMPLPQDLGLVNAAFCYCKHCQGSCSDSCLKLCLAIAARCQRYIEMPSKLVIYFLIYHCFENCQGQGGWHSAAVLAWERRNDFIFYC